MPPSADEGLDAGAERVEVVPGKPERKSDRGKGYQSVYSAVHGFPRILLLDEIKSSGERLSRDGGFRRAVSTYM
jgi:hypothetical protein